MENEKEPGLLSILSNIIVAYLNRLTGLISLAELEAKLAVKTLISMCILFYFLTLLLFATWFSLLGILFFYLVSLNFSSLFAFMLIALINILLMVLIIVSILMMKKNLFFRATRRQLQLTIDEKERIINE